jgi:uncharacterized protein (TIGR02145 family)
MFKGSTMKGMEMIYEIRIDFMVFMILILIAAVSCEKQNEDKTISDIEGNVYQTVKIGNQLWMAENLRTSRFNDSTAIQKVEDCVWWESLKNPGFCWYDNNPEINMNIYGALYNWYTVNSGKLCPSGWHVPTDNDWKILEKYLGMTQAEADASDWRGEGLAYKMKSTTDWNNLSYGDNSSGFSGLPGGMRWLGCGFDNIKDMGCWWSATEHGEGEVWYRSLSSNTFTIGRPSAFKNWGLSVRCIKN